MNTKLGLSLASWTVFLGIALGQNTAPPTTPPGQDVKQDRQEVKSDLKEMQSLDASHAQAVKDLNAKEKAAMDAVKDDKSLTPEQRKAKLAALRKDFNAQRKALNEKFRADKRAIHNDMKKDRADIRQDERSAREAREERRQAHESVARSEGHGSHR